MGNDIYMAEKLAIMDVLQIIGIHMAPRREDNGTDKHINRVYGSTLVSRNIQREKSLAASYNGLSHIRSFSIRSFLLAGAQTCQLFKNDISATCTCKRSKENNSDFKALN